MFDVCNNHRPINANRKNKKMTRIFSPIQKVTQYRKQNGICNRCKKHFKIENMEADHIKPWVDGGKTVLDNCQMLCENCHNLKTRMQLRK